MQKVRLPFCPCFVEVVEVRSLARTGLLSNAFHAARSGQLQPVHSDSRCVGIDMTDCQLLAVRAAFPIWQRLGTDSSSTGHKKHGPFQDQTKALVLGGKWHYMPAWSPFRFQLNSDLQKQRLLGLQREAKLSMTVLHRIPPRRGLNFSAPQRATHIRRWIKAWHIASCRWSVRSFHGPGRAPTLRRKGGAARRSVVWVVTPKSRQHLRWTIQFLSNQAGFNVRLVWRLSLCTVKG